MRWIKIAIIIICATMYGCATGGILNPFQSGFQCATTDTGECIPLKEAYDISLKEDNESVVALVLDGRNSESNGVGEGTYKQAVYREVANLLEKPKTPLVVPPKTVRVLILPYQDSTGTLYMQRYLYFFASDPEWVLDINSIEEK